MDGIKLCCFGEKSAGKRVPVDSLSEILGKRLIPFNKNELFWLYSKRKVKKRLQNEGVSCIISEVVRRRVCG